MGKRKLKRKLAALRLQMRDLQNDYNVARAFADMNVEALEKTLQAAREQLGLLGCRVSILEEQVQQLEQGRDNDLGETVPLDSRDVGPAFRLEGETADRIRAGIHEHAGHFTGGSRTWPQPRSILGCAGPNEIGMATDEFLEAVPGW